jgi:hypothetical protein
MHDRMEFVRRAAGRLADFLRPNDRIIVAPFAKSMGPITGPTDDRETIAGAVHAIEAYLSDRMLPLVVQRGDGGVIVRPPSD